MVSFLSFLVLNLLGRLVFILANSSFTDLSRFILFSESLLVGLRLDAVVAGYLTIPVWITIFLPFIGWSSSLYRRLFFYYHLAAFGLLIFLNIIDIEFYREFGGHINFMILRHVTSGSEIWEYFWNKYPVFLYLFSFILSLTLAGYVFSGWVRKLKSVNKSPVWAGALFFIISAGALVTVSRGGWQERPIDWGYAMFSNDPDVNQSALNGIFFFSRSVIEMSSEKYLAETLSFYPDEEAARITLDMLSSDNALPAGVRQMAESNNPPSNVVMIILESYSGPLCGYLNPDMKEVTPNLDKLAAEGIAFTRAYSNGMRSAHGISSILTSWPALPGLPLIYQVETLWGITTLGSILKEQGYTTMFSYGGDAHYDNMSGFMKTNGFDHIFDKDALPPNADGTMWGVFDHYLLNNVSEILDTTSAPFLSVVFTTTNHQPWEVPPSYQEGNPDFQNAKYNRAKTMGTMRYVDTALGEFFDRARKQPWFSNTIFVITSDHGLRINRHNSDDLMNALIPLVIYAPGIIPPRKPVETVTSQVDIIPMVLSVLNIPYGKYRLMGNNPLLTDEGFAARVNQDRIYWIEKDYLYKEVLNQNTSLYRITDEGMLPVDEDSVFTRIQRRCRAYIQTAYFSFKEKNRVDNSQSHSKDIISKFQTVTTHN